MSSKIQLTDYFRAVERHLESSGKMPSFYFRVRICDELIELRFPTKELEQVGRSSLSGFITEDTSEPDAAFFYWYDRCDDYLPAGEGERSSVWKSNDETGSLMIGTDRDVLMGRDYARKRFYSAQPAPKDEWQLHCRHSMVNAFAFWARHSDKLLLHAASVGYEGTGVLVVGRGGRGKSTFAVSCLTEGLDFVSDDYTLITSSGKLYAMPLYSCVGVRVDMCEKLTGLGQPSTTVLGKPLFEIPGEQYCKKLNIKAIIMPLVAGDDEPSIYPTQKNSAMAQLIGSTITQLESRHDTELIQQMSSRLAHLPVYEMRMSTDLSKNPAFLREFIEKEI